MTQTQTIQLKVSPKFKNMLQSLAESRGLPLSTYIKFVLMEELKEDPLWNKLQEEGDKQVLLDQFLASLKA